MTTITHAIFCLDFVALTPVVIKVEPHADPSKIQTAVWTLPTAWAVQKDMERRAADYEREADEADRAGRVEIARITRDFASNTLTLATDLLEALRGAQHMARAA